jgi:hypothetical protein
MATIYVEIVRRVYVNGEAFGEAITDEEYAKLMEEARAKVGEGVQ